MKKQNIILTQAPAVIGDAALKIFRISQSESKNKTDGGKLIHRHLYFECHLLLRGEYVYSVGDRAIRIGQKQLLIIPPNWEHQPFTPSSEVAERVFGLTVESTKGELHCYPYFYAAIQKASCMPITLTDGLYHRLIAFLDGFDEQVRGLRPMCRQLTEVYPLLYALLDEIDAFDALQDTTIESGNADIMVTLDWLVNDPSCSLEDIAIALGYSYRHTARKIKEVYGDSLVNLRRRIMLASAKSLLASEPEQTLDNIACTSGFSGVRAMIRAFRSELGMTPTEYRSRVLFEKTRED